jgi:hypothetical protein
LNRVFPSACWQRLEATRCRNGNNARAGWTWPALILGCICLGWSGCREITARFQQARQALTALLAEALPGSYQGFCQQLRSGGWALFEQVMAQLRPRIIRLGRKAWYHGGWIPFAVDGSRFDLPRSRANERAFSRAGRKRTGPQLWATLLTHLPTGAIWNWRQGPGTASERHHLRAMLDTLPQRSLLVADAGFVGFELLAELASRPQAFLIRCAGNVSLRSWAGCLGEQVDVQRAGGRVYVWTKQAQRQRQPALALRLIVLKTAGQPVCLLTNVQSNPELPKLQAAQLYRMRWGIEVTHRHLKQTLERRRLRCGNPDNGLMELAANVLALAVLMLHALTVLGVRIGQVSVAAVVKLLRKAVEGLTWRILWTGLAWALKQAVRDDYTRHAPKTRRRWPSKKRDAPPRPPEVRTFSEQELRNLLDLGYVLVKTG